MNQENKPEIPKVTAKHPYASIPQRSHWKRAVQGRAPEELTDWYQKKFDITHMRIATAGSCFAQHIGRRLRHSGFRFVDTEAGPDCMSQDALAQFGYGLYSARFGNIYTTRQLLQLMQRAFGEFLPKERVWSKDDGCVDPFRPAIEPLPYRSKQECGLARIEHLKRVRLMFKTADLFVFTLGLTETWISRSDGAAFPLAPGVSGGSYHPRKHALLNLSYEDVLADLEQVIAKCRQLNPNMHFLFTVSPVPLMATATKRHVVTATTYSKSVLRAAAGYLCDKYDFVDYFPSYEIISAPTSRGMFFGPDGREVLPEGVDHVMTFFFNQHRPPVTRPPKARLAEQQERLVCEEELLSVFGDKSCTA